VTNAIPFSIIKPTVQTPYSIDFEWWKKNERSWHVLLLGYLSAEDQTAFENGNPEQVFDIVDPITAEVKQVDALQHLLISKVARQEGFITETTSLVESVFRLLLANGNRPMNSTEIGEKLGRPATLILQVLSGKRIYQGLRPYLGSMPAGN
jgi:hypothetical protein